MRLNLNTTDTNTHECQSRREGEWIVYSCTRCPDYERRHNLKTGEMVVIPAGDPTVLHRGSTNQYDPAMINRSLN